MPSQLFLCPNVLLEIAGSVHLPAFLIFCFSTAERLSLSFRGSQTIQHFGKSPSQRDRRRQTLVDLESLYDKLYAHEVVRHDDANLVGPACMIHSIHQSCFACATRPTIVSHTP
jgi:hypothetical protein